MRTKKPLPGETGQDPKRGEAALFVFSLFGNVLIGRHISL
jgi:hypothetical protein